MKTDKKRARIGMGSDCSPESSKFKNSSSPHLKSSLKKTKSVTGIRTLKDMLNTMSQKKTSTSKDQSDTMNDNIEEIKMTDDSDQGEKVTHLIAEVQSTDDCIVFSKTTTIQACGKVPSSRWGHTVCLLNESDAVIIGGQGDRQVFSKDAVWHLDMGPGVWKAPKTILCDGQTQKPETRIGHTTVFDPTLRVIYLFGGSKNLKWFNDVHILDTQEWKWQIVKTNGKAPTRAYHSATLYRHEFWIFGGVYPRPDPQPDGCSNEIHVYSPMEESWYSPIVMGKKPEPRSGHSATLLGDQLVVFGGWDAPVCFNDLHVLDLCVVEWNSPETTGTPPSPRSWHGSCPLAGNRVLIHGGYNGNNALNDCFIFNLDFLSWTEVKLMPSLATRVGHTTMCLPYKHSNDRHDQVILFGGGDNEGSFFNDLICLNIPFEKTNII